MSASSGLASGSAPTVSSSSAIPQIGQLQVEQDRYCVDVLTQVSAVRAVLHKVEDQILRDHVSNCVAGAFVSGNPVEQRHKVEELVDAIGRMTRRFRLKGSMRGILMVRVRRLDTTGARSTQDLGRLLASS